MYLQRVFCCWKWRSRLTQHSAGNSISRCHAFSRFQTPAHPGLVLDGSCLLRGMVPPTARKRHRSHRYQLSPRRLARLSSSAFVASERMAAHFFSLLDGAPMLLVFDDHPSLLPRAGAPSPVMPAAMSVSFQSFWCIVCQHLPDLARPFTHAGYRSSNLLWPLLTAL